MPNNYNKTLVSYSQKLRTNMTDEEKHLWYDFLKTFPVQVKRQKVIQNYIVDFFISSKNIVIELDGAQHSTTENKIKDEKRDKVFEKLGILVLRYTNGQINSNFNSVCRDILKHAGIEECDYVLHKRHSLSQRKEKL